MERGIFGGDQRGGDGRKEVLYNVSIIVIIYNQNKFYLLYFFFSFFHFFILL